MSPGNVKLIQLHEAQPRRWIHNHQSPVGQGQKPCSLPLFVGNSYLGVCLSRLSWPNITSNEALMAVSPLPPTNWPFSPFWTYRNNNSCYSLGIYYMLFFFPLVDLSIELICQRENHRPQVSSLVLKPVMPNLDSKSDWVAVLTFPRDVTLIDQLEIFWTGPMR